MSLLSNCENRWESISDIEIDNEFLITKFPCVCLTYAVFGRVKDIWWCPLLLEISSRSRKAFRSWSSCLSARRFVCADHLYSVASQWFVYCQISVCGYLPLLTPGVLNRLYHLRRATISFLSELLLCLCTIPLLSIQHIHFKNFYFIYQT